MKKTELSTVVGEHFYVRDYWGDGRWARRPDGPFSSRESAEAYAKDIAKQIGRGARVQVVHVVMTAVVEVKP